MSTKEKLLAYLKENRGEWISGEFLSKKMLISRSAIWKHIRNLREDGYGILSSPKKGYFLQQISQMVLPNEIREGLDFGEAAKRSAEGGPRAEGKQQRPVRVRRGGYVPGIGEAENLCDLIFDTKSGSVADRVVKSEKGWHIVKVLSVQPPRLRPLDEVRAEVERALGNDRRRELMEKLLDDLYRKYAVKRYPGVLEEPGDASPLEQD